MRLCSAFNLIETQIKDIKTSGLAVSKPKINSKQLNVGRNILQNVTQHLR
jgi:hypothetical protein